MKWSPLFLAIFFFFSCGEGSKEITDNDLKLEIKRMYEHHIQDLKNLDHTSLMRHYANTNDHVLFGDGEYWGNYETVSNIWENFTQNTREILEWKISNEHIHLLSESSASYLMEYYNSRVDSAGDTLNIRGSVSYGLKKIDDDWRIVTTNVSHFPVQ
ncbi:nuclear transport factor 2 family protein [Poritiphilus flavus]|uniref:SnoaL-like domain-containing protein n=1 Tax=Poritiphilus flavus TaxID=2697053 RepID=A0A6L9EF74_9FLAO|nr:nuclear transport factor 2 family protein [Poritiphilus flavus]NAS13331.1 hypothetical protein [Poritiphilus flavus]